MMTSFFRVSRFALNNFWRDIWLSSATIIIFVLAISLVGILSGVRVVTDQAITILRSKVDIIVSFKPATSEKLVKDLQVKIEKLPETTTTVYISADENLQRFKDIHVSDEIIIQGTEAVGKNPFGPSLKIQARTLDEYPKISKVFEDKQYADTIENSSKTIEKNQGDIQKLSNFTQQVNRFRFILTLIFALIAILVVINTMRIAIYTHREEIGIMKLVGASNTFVRAPFLVESILIGLIAAALAAGLLWLGIALTSGWLNSLFQGYDVNMPEYFRHNFLAIFWLPLAGALALAIVSAGIAVGRYLRK